MPLPQVHGEGLLLGLVHQIGTPTAEEPWIRAAEHIAAGGRLERSLHGSLIPSSHLFSLYRLYCLTKSPSRLAATVSFETVSPEVVISCTCARTRSTSCRRGPVQASTAPAPAAPLPAMAAAWRRSASPMEPSARSSACRSK